MTTNQSLTAEVPNQQSPSDHSEPATRTSTPLRRLAAFVAILTLTFLVPAATARADTTYSAGTVSAGASCDRYYHSMTIQGTIVLSNRFPRGAYVATRYAYYTVNSSLLRTSAINTTAWMYSNAAPSTMVVGDVTIGPGISSDLPAFKINTWGQWRVQAQVGVWNGVAYEYSSWDISTGYDNYGQFGIYSFNNRCVASVT